MPCAPTAAGCFVERMRVATKPATDMVDPFACPVCKATSLLVRIPPDTTNTDVRRATKWQELWTATAAVIDDDDDDDQPPACRTLPTTACGYVPAILFCAYWHSHKVLLAADRLTSDQQRAATLARDLQPLSDTARTRCRRGGAAATLARVHTGMHKRRRLDLGLLEEARDLVDLMEEESTPRRGGGEHGRFVVGGGVLYLLHTIRPEGNTHLWVHTNLGRAVAQVLRQCAGANTTCAVRADDQSSRVMVAVLAADSGSGAIRSNARSAARRCSSHPSRPTPWPDT